MKVALRQVDVVVMAFTCDWNDSFVLVIDECHLISVGTGFLGLKLEDQLLRLANFEDTLSLAYLKTVWHLDEPLGGLLSDVADHNGLLLGVLDGHGPEV